MLILLPLVLAAAVLLGAPWACGQEAEEAPEAEPARDWRAEELRVSLERATEILDEPGAAWLGRRWTASAAPAPGGVSTPLFDHAMTATDAEDRIRALEGHLLTGGDAALEACFGALIDPVPAVRDTAADILRRLCEAPGQGDLCNALYTRVAEACRGTSAMQRAAMEQALPQWPEILGETALDVLTDDTQPAEDRATAAYCLGRMGLRAASAPLAQACWSDSSPLAWEAAKALHALHDPERVRDWAKLTTHELPAVRRLAVSALASLGGPESLAALLVLARGGGKTGTMQILATNALAGWPKETAVPALMEALRVNPTVRTYAAARLRELTGVMIGDVPQDWNAWYENGEVPEQQIQGQGGPKVEVGYW